MNGCDRLPRARRRTLRRRSPTRRRAVDAAAVALALISGLAMATELHAAQASAGSPGPWRIERFDTRFAVVASPLSPATHGALDSQTELALRPTGGFDAPALFADPPSKLRVTLAATGAFALASMAVVGAAFAFAADDATEDPPVGWAVAMAAITSPATAWGAHRASGGRGNMLTATLLGYAATGLAAAFGGTGGAVLGTVFSIPVAVVVETR